jgi:hypothetical protein
MIKKSWLYISIAILILIIPLAYAQDENLYQYDSLKVKLSVDGKFVLTPDKSTASLKQIKTELALFPIEDFRQQLVEVDTRSGKVDDGKIFYQWIDGKIEAKNFGYDAIVLTNNQRTKVEFKVPYPLKSSSGMQEYLLPSETIDSNNPTIIAKANELAEGETDEFKIAFKLANWVEENVKYDLNSLTASAAQKASWVLENKEGVCDEMTSLFVAMARSLGIPARFVSGISYTTSEKFTEKWQSHGWAEVYFPEIGWVSFDIAFGEYGYVDVTHVKLRDSVDPADPATKYEWLADGVNVQTEPLDFKVEVIDNGNKISEDISMEQELLSHSIGFGSYNLVKGIVKNDASYYAATMLRLAVPKEVEIIGNNKRTILLEPKQVKETYWIIKVPENLESGYWYTFPTVIYNEKNISVKDEFTVMQGERYYSEREAKQLVIEDEEKSYSRKVTFKCNYSNEVKLQSQSPAVCVIKNVGNVKLDGVDFCVGGVCQMIDLPINQELSASVKLKSDQAGWSKLLVSANNKLIDKKTAFEYAVLDAPNVSVKLTAPEQILFGQSAKLEVLINKTSFSLPQKVEVLVKGRGMEQKFTVEEMREPLLLEADLRGDRIGKNNIYSVLISWKDKEGKAYSVVQEVYVVGIGSSFSEKVKMFFNGLVG